MMITSLKDIRKTLEEAKIIALIGCSPNPYRTSNYAFRYLKEKGYEVIPVNPGQDEIDGVKCYRKLNDIPEDTEIDMINIFRNSRYTVGVIEEVAQWKNKTGQAPVIWTQLDVSSPEAEVLAENEGLPYIRNKCIMVELDHL